MAQLESCYVDMSPWAWKILPVTLRSVFCFPDFNMLRIVIWHDAGINETVDGLLDSGDEVRRVRSTSGVRTSDHADPNSISPRILARTIGSMPRLPDKQWSTCVAVSVSHGPMPFVANVLRRTQGTGDVQDIPSAFVFVEIAEVREFDESAVNIGHEPTRSDSARSVHLITSSDSSTRGKW